MQGSGSPLYKKGATFCARKQPTFVQESSHLGPSVQKSGRFLCNKSSTFCTINRPPFVQGSGRFLCKEVANFCTRKQLLSVQASGQLLFSNAADLCEFPVCRPMNSSLVPTVKSTDIVEQPKIQCCTTAAKAKFRLLFRPQQHSQFWKTAAIVFLH